MYTTYDVFDDMIRLRDAVDSFFNDIPVARRGVDFPYVNLYDTGESVGVKALVPGVAPADLHIELVDSSLVIEGDRKSDLADRPYIRRERSFGKFKKSIRLPYEVDRDKVQAELKNGVLSVILHKSEAAKPKKIEIH